MSLSRLSFQIKPHFQPTPTFNNNQILTDTHTVMGFYHHWNITPPPGMVNVDFKHPNSSAIWNNSRFQAHPLSNVKVMIIAILCSNYKAFGITPHN